MNHKRFKEGDKIVYRGPREGYVPELAVIGTVATVTKVFQFSYPYLIEFKPTTVFPGNRHERVDRVIRTSGVQWEKVTEESEVSA